MKILLLIVLLVVLLGINFMRVGSWDASYDKGRPRRAKMELQMFSVALEMFRSQCGRYPTTQEGLDALIGEPSNLPSGKWQKLLDCERVPNDPWDTPYVYCCPGLHNTNGFDVYSCGYDRKSKSRGDDHDDINNWNP